MSRAEVAQSLADDIKAVGYAEIRGVTMAGSDAGKANDVVFRLWRNKDLLAEVLSEKGPTLPEKDEGVWWPIPTVIFSVLAFAAGCWLYA